MAVKNNYKKCLQHQIKIETTKIQKMTDEYWMIYSEDDLIITENCNQELHESSIKGTYILVPDAHCETQAGNIDIIPTLNTTMASLQLPTIQTPLLQYNIQKKTELVDLTNVDFSDIKELLQSAKFSESDGTPEFVPISLNTSVWTVLLYIIAFSTALSFVYIKFRKILGNRNSLEPALPSPDNFSLREGGVKCDNPHQYAFVSTSAQLQHLEQ
ncbi:hypothetical protein ACJJTC_010746 [Scirpophaga incertulas]